MHRPLKLSAGTQILNLTEFKTATKSAITFQITVLIKSASGKSLDHIVTSASRSAHPIWLLITAFTPYCYLEISS